MSNACITANAPIAETPELGPSVFEISDPATRSSGCKGTLLSARKQRAFVASKSVIAGVFANAVHPKMNDDTTKAFGTETSDDAADRDRAASFRQHMWQAIGTMDRELHCYIRRHVPNATEAEDVLHDFYLRVFEYAHTLRDRGSIRTWLYRVLRSSLMEHLRSKRRQSNIVNRLGLWASEPHADMSYSDRLLFADLFAQLKPEYSDILMRLQVRADTPWEAAADLTTTSNNVCVRHFRARAALREMYVKCNVEFHGIGERARRGRPAVG